MMAHQPGNPKIVISVWGRFHAFDLARELQQLDALSALITSYPRFVVERYGVDRSRIWSRPVSEVICRLGQKAPVLGRLTRSDLRAKQLFEKSARKALRSVSGDVFVGWSGTSLSLLRDAKARGMLTILERCSTHIVEQTKLLVDEYSRFGRAFSDTPSESTEQELAEYEETDYIAVPSTFVKESFLRQGFSADKLLLIPYGTDISLFRPDTAPHEPFRIIQVGAVSIRKGFRYVDEAFRAAAIPDSELWFVGGVSPEAKRYFSSKPHPRITLHGHKPQSELVKYYNQSDVATLASVEEGMAYVLAQAAACGLPIVCTENTGGREIVGNDTCGIMVPPRDPVAMAHAFRLLHDDTALREQLGMAARECAGSRFSWCSYAERALWHYRRLVAKGSS
jgi:glycosyltransferase involved in cell wall biosynthesis